MRPYIFLYAYLQMSQSQFYNLLHKNELNFQQINNRIRGMSFNIIVLKDLQNSELRILKHKFCFHHIDYQNMSKHMHLKVNQQMSV